MKYEPSSEKSCGASLALCLLHAGRWVDSDPSVGGYCLFYHVCVQTHMRAYDKYAELSLSWTCFNKVGQIILFPKIWSLRLFSGSASLLDSSKSPLMMSSTNWNMNVRFTFCSNCPSLQAFSDCAWNCSPDIRTSKFIEVIANIEGLVVVLGVLIVNELHSPWWRSRGEAAGVKLRPISSFSHPSERCQQHFEQTWGK